MPRHESSHPWRIRARDAVVRRARCRSRELHVEAGRARRAHAHAMAATESTSRLTGPAASARSTSALATIFAHRDNVGGSRSPRPQRALARLVFVQFFHNELDEVVDADSGQFSKFLGRLERCRGHPKGAASVPWYTHNAEEQQTMRPRLPKANAEGDARRVLSGHSRRGGRGHQPVEQPRPGDGLG